MNILITSVGRRSYMIQYFKEALQGKGSVHACNSEVTYALQLADHYFRSPPIYDNNYIHTLLDYCRDYDISAIISLFDIDLPVLAKSKHKFDEAGVTPILSDYSFISICNDKWKSYQFIIENGFKAPKTFLSLQEAEKAVSLDQLSFPLIIKPRWGMGSIGIFEADDELELKVLYNKTKKAITDSYLKYESQEDPDQCVLIQEKLMGEEWGLDIFNDLEGKFLACVPKRKIAMRAGETDIAETSHRNELKEFGRKISSITRHIGNLDLDFFISDKKFYILEFNARFGGQYPFSHISGVNFPKAIISMLQDSNPKPEDFIFTETKAFKNINIYKI